MASSNEYPISSNQPNRKNKWCVFLIPYLARGHIITMTDFAGLLSASDPEIEPIIAVTPGNTGFITSSLKSHPVKILTYPFPSVNGTCNVETVGMGSSSESSTIDQAVRADSARPCHEQFLRRHKPDAVVADIKFPWIGAIGAELKIPCLYFVCSGAFTVMVYSCLSKMRADVGLHDHIIVSGLSGPEICMPVLELPEIMLPKEEKYAKYVDDAFGIVVNTFRGC